MLSVSRSSGNLNRGISFDGTSTDNICKKYLRSQSLFYLDTIPVEKTVQFDEIDNPLNKKLSASEENIFATMKLEINRLNTFIGKWPLTYVKPEHLAGNGFFYLQSEDQVQCAFCYVIIDDWNVGQKPLKEHIKKSPRCPFLLSSNVGNVPAVSTPGNIPTNFSHYKPRYPRMSNLKERLDTYKNWPLKILSTQQLAECGFYYTGASSNDEVTCYFCGGSLGKWELNDDPWIEHCKHFPHCVYLQLVRRNNGIPRQNSAPVHKAPVIPQPIMHQPGPSARSMEHELIKEACNIFPKYIVDKVVLQHLKKMHSHYTSLSDLCEAILEYTDKNSSSVSQDVTGYTNHIAQNTIEQKSESPYPESFVNTNIASSDTDKEESQQPRIVRDNLLCKICMDRELCMSFQPCGHVVACSKCAQVIFTCPLCRTPITSKQRIYFS